MPFSFKEIAASPSGRNPNNKIGVGIQEKKGIADSPRRRNKEEGIKKRDWQSSADKKL